MRVVAVDWSGESRGGGRRKIWAAESSHGHLRDLESGRTRDEVAEYLIELAENDAALVVGFDFAFSMPRWFVESVGAASGPEFWEVAEREGERWLRECPAPFFGHKGTTKPTDGAELRRRTEKESGAAKSVFQIAGSGQVGPGSIRGMPILRRLRDAGFRVWPFDEPAPGEPLVIEIYPRLLTGEVVKRNEQERLGHLEKYAARISPRLREIASGEEDEFDAAISAAVMNRYLHELVELDAGDEIDRIEGNIWRPSDPAFAAGEPLPNFLDPALPEGDFFFDYIGTGINDGPFNADYAQLMDWGDSGPDGTVGLPTAGTPRYLRVLKREGDRIFTADGIWIRLVPFEAADAARS